MSKIDFKSPSNISILTLIRILFLFQSFYLYLYFGSMAFLFYMYAMLCQKDPRTKKIAASKLFPYHEHLKWKTIIETKKLYESHKISHSCSLSPSEEKWSGNTVSGCQLYRKSMSTMKKYRFWKVIIEVQELYKFPLKKCEYRRSSQ